MIRAVAPLAPTFLVMATRIRAEENTAWFQTCFQFQQHARQFLARYMKQRGVGEHAIEMVVRQIELEEVLLPYVAAAVGTRHYGQVLGAFQTDRDVTELVKQLEVAFGTSGKIEDIVVVLRLD